MVVFCIHSYFPRHCVLLSGILGEPRVGLLFALRQGGVAVDPCFLLDEKLSQKRIKLLNYLKCDVNCLGCFLGVLSSIKRRKKIIKTYRERIVKEFIALPICRLIDYEKWSNKVPWY